MMIRDIDRPLLPRTRRGKEVSPLRRTAEGLGLFLGRLSEALHDDDDVDDELKTTRRNTARTFKWSSAQKKEAAAVELELDEEQTEIFNTLREARNITSDATSVAMALHDRTVAQEKLENMFVKLSGKNIDVLKPSLDNLITNGEIRFTIMTVEGARAAHSQIDEMIFMFVGARLDDNGGDIDAADTPYIDHGAAISAAEQVREFLLGEGPVRAFARFREINRANVLGLLQD